MKRIFLTGALVSALFVITGCVSIGEAILDLGVCHATDVVKDKYIKSCTCT